ncbi:MAG: hypothetical protein IJL66_04835 [Lachnospiraceae bacterium]|nr:hypothetical protein [Lachnospiraceae bacterium]
MDDVRSITYEELLSEQGEFTYRVVGQSMLPLLRRETDLFTAKKKGPERCRKYDVALYRSGDQYILHRVIAVRENDYVIRGDHNGFNEYGITDADILAVMTGFTRKGKVHSVDEPLYRLYSRIWVGSFPVRMLYRKVRRAGRKVLALFGGKRT